MALRGDSPYHPAGYIMSVIGAILVLWIYQMSNAPAVVVIGLRHEKLLGLDTG